MIDLEETLSAFVEQAPEPPAVEGIVLRAKRRQRRRRGLALATTLVVLAAGLAGATAIVSSRRTSHEAGVVPTVDHVRLTLLDGSQLEVSGPESLGLTTIAPAFNAALGPVSGSQPGIGHAFSVTRMPPGDLGAVVGRYPTHDGHELVVHRSNCCADAVTNYGGWWLTVFGGHEPADWPQFASELNAKETPDGFLVVEPTDASWKVGPTDAPDAQIGGEAYGSGAAFSFFGPKTYPAGCPDAANTSTRTGQGWPVLAPERCLVVRSRGEGAGRRVESEVGRHRDRRPARLVHRRRRRGRELHDAAGLEVRDHRAVIGARPLHHPGRGRGRRPQHAVADRDQRRTHRCHAVRRRCTAAAPRATRHDRRRASAHRDPLSPGRRCARRHVRRLDRPHHRDRCDESRPSAHRIVVRRARDSRRISGARSTPRRCTSPTAAAPTSC